MVSVSLEKQAEFEKTLQNKDVNFTQLARVTAYNCHIESVLFSSLSVDKKHDDTALEQILD